MSRKTVLIEVDAEDETLMRDYAAFLAEMRDLAGSAPEGRVLAACEEAVVERGRTIQQRVLQRAVQERVDAAEKKGRR